MPSRAATGTPTRRPGCRCSSSRQSRCRARSIRSRSRSDRAQPIWLRKWTLWGLRLWGGGIAFIVLAFLLGRVAEGLVEGTGAVTAAVFGVGTMAGSLGPTVFGHLPDALALFAAYIVATRAQNGRATGSGSGCSPGSGCCSSTRRASPALVLLIYAALRGGRAGCARAGRGRHPGRARARLLRLDRVRRSLAALVPLHRQHVHAAAAAKPLRRRHPDAARDLDAADRRPRAAPRLAGARDRSRRASSASGAGSGSKPPSRPRSRRSSCSTRPVTSCRTAGCRRGRASPPPRFPSCCSGSRSRSFGGATRPGCSRSLSVGLGALRRADLVGRQQARLPRLAGDDLVAARDLTA